MSVILSQEGVDGKYIKCVTELNNANDLKDWFFLLSMKLNEQTLTANVNKRHWMFNMAKHVQTSKPCDKPNILKSIHITVIFFKSVSRHKN